MKCANDAGKPAKTVCRATHISPCPGVDCPFYITHAQAIADRQKAALRLSKLPRDQQQYIADTYYKGIKIWLTWVEEEEEAVWQKTR